MLAVADDRVGAASPLDIEESQQVLRPELAVGVGQQDAAHVGQLERGGDARAHGAAVTLVDLVVHRDDPAAVAPGQLVEHLAGAVGAAVVDDDDPVLDAGVVEGGEEVLDGGLEVVLLAVGRHDHRHAVDVRTGDSGRNAVRVESDART